MGAQALLRLVRLQGRDVALVAVARPLLLLLLLLRRRVVVGRSVAGVDIGVAVTGRPLRVAVSLRDVTIVVQPPTPAATTTSP